MLKKIFNFFILIVLFHDQVKLYFTAANPRVKSLGRWCCLNEAEYAKCLDWTNAWNSTNTNSSVILECVLAEDKYECFKFIFEDKADLMVADAGEIYTAGKYYNLLPITTEIYNAGPNQPSYSDHYSVAVVKRGSGMTLASLKGANSCHGGVGTSSGWNIPISTLIEKQLLEIVDCNNHVKAATNFFNKMCAPDALNTQFNPTGDNPTSACDLCKGRIGSNFCTNQDPYAGNIGAMYCLIDGGGDVAFVRHNSLQELAAINSSININDFELLCPNYVGSPYNTPGMTNLYPSPTAPISEYANCNWGIVPGRGVLTSSRKALSQRRSYREFLKESSTLFGGMVENSPITNPTFMTTTVPSNFFNFDLNQFLNQSQQQTTDPNQDFNLEPMPVRQNFKIFDSTSYGGRDLIFLDQTQSFKDLDEKITYLTFLREYTFLEKLIF